ncbi:MAG: hypothetical protein ACJ8AW_33370 [Rhodopila sp.]
MRVAVYTIALNESVEVDAWAEAVTDADVRIVVDTGSTDGTQERLTTIGVSVFQCLIRPWRFDDALNAAVALVPAEVDVCIRVDLDERPRRGWRQALERAWTEQHTQLNYVYNWSPEVRKMGDRVHARTGFRWKGSTHERLLWYGKSDYHRTFTPDLVIDQFQRTKPRPHNLPLLAQDAAEWPTDADISLTYGRELMFEGMKEEAKSELLRYISIAGEVGVRPAYAFRLLGYVDRENAQDWLLKAEQAHSCPSNYLAMAEYYQEIKNWRLCYTSAQYAITLLRRDAATATAPDWGDDHRLLSGPYLHVAAAKAAWHLYDFEAAYGHTMEAVRRAPKDEGLRANLELISAKIADGATLHPDVRPEDTSAPAKLQQNVE